MAVVPNFVYRRVVIRGRWDHDHSMLLGPRVRHGVHGYHVITPLVRSGASTVLVDRGFISKDFVNNHDRSEVGEVEVQGMLRTSHKRNSFTPDNRPNEGAWYWADVNAMAEYAGGHTADVQPVFVEQIFGESLSEVGQERPRSMNHRWPRRRRYIEFRQGYTCRSCCYSRRAERTPVLCDHLVSPCLSSDNLLPSSITFHRYSLSAFTATMLGRLILKRRAQKRVKPLPR